MTECLRFLPATFLLAITAPTFAQPVPPGPGTGDESPGEFTLRDAPETRLVSGRDALAPTPGGLTADQVAARTREVSPEAEAKDAAIRAAAAKVDKTVVMFLPRIKVTATYRRVSPTDSSLGGGALVFTQEPTEQLVMPPCTTSTLEGEGCPLPLGAAALSFPTIENQYLLTASLGVPLSDYVLRLSSALNATKIYKRSTEIQKQAALVNAASAGRVAYYNWLRTVAAQAVAETSLARLQGLLNDTRAAFEVGSATKADVLRVEALIAGAEQMVAETKALRELSNEQLSVLMDEPSRPYAVGEDVLSPPAQSPEDLTALVTEAHEKRLEMKALRAVMEAQDQGIRAARVGKYPRLDAFADFTYARPNPTVFPQREEWNESWVVGLSLSYTLNDPLDSRASIREIEANRAEVAANRTALSRGIRVEVAAAHADAKRARFAIEAARRAAAAAEEGYRVARELYRAGRGTTTDLVTAESELVQASLREVNALLDLKVADAKLEHAVGRDVGGR